VDALFRRESLDHVYSPEQLDACLNAPRPRLWLLAAAMLAMLLLAGLCLSSTLVHDRMRLNGLSLGGGKYVCYVPYRPGAAQINAAAEVLVDLHAARIARFAAFPQSKAELAAELGSEFAADCLFAEPWSRRVELDSEYKAAKDAFVDVALILSHTKLIDYALGAE
jgi:hypothetical protein